MCVISFQTNFLTYLGLLLAAGLSAGQSFRMGESCRGEVLLEQQATTSSMEPFVVNYGGEPGVEISCIYTHDLTAENRTLTSLQAGGVGQHFAVLQVLPLDRQVADFNVTIMGTRFRAGRVDRADKPRARNPNPLLRAADNLEQIIKSMRGMAEQLDAVRLQRYGMGRGERRNSRLTRMKRQQASTTPNPNPLLRAADEVDRIVKTLQSVASRLDAVQRLLRVLGNPLGFLNATH